MFVALKLLKGILNIETITFLVLSLMFHIPFSMKLIFKGQVRDTMKCHQKQLPYSILEDQKLNDTK